MLKRIAILGLFAGALAIMAPRADAAPMTGSLSLSAQAIAGGDPVIPVNGATGAATALNLATGLDFGSVVSGTPTPGVGGVFTVDSASLGGSFVGLVGQSGAIRDFSFAGAGSVNYPLPPVVGLERIPIIGAPNFSFDLLTVSISTQSSVFLNLQGTGLFHLTGFDNTPGVFSFTVTQIGATLSFAAAEGVVSTVPEPGSMILLGTGLMGLGASVRRRLARKQ
jgi:hypothetical protein